MARTPTDYTDTVIAITGASRGLGRTMAVGFAARGARLVLGARSMYDLQQVAADCRAAGSPGVEVVPCDVTDQAQVDAMVARALETWGKLDIFIANAATSPANVAPDKRYTDLTSYDYATFRTIMDVNITGVWRCIRAAIPKMGEGGVFLVIGSGTGRRPTPGNTVYGTSKAGDDAITRVLAAETKPLGIRVHCLSPGGMTDTNLFGSGGMPEMLKQRGFLTADVIVPAALWLCSDEAADVTGGFVSGKEFNVDGPDGTREKIAAGNMPS